MKKTTRTIFLFLGVIFPILIGASHTYTHFSQLIQPEVAGLLQASIEINGQSQSLWNSWGIMSFMMGIAFMIIGLLNGLLFAQMKKDQHPPQAACLIMLLYLGCVIYAGATFEQAPQLYGGIGGFLCMLICIGLNCRQNKHGDNINR
ncbi:MAG: hypothetical protein AAF696_17790 [Bacteroidota bacterium]